MPFSEPKDLFPLLDASDIRVTPPRSFLFLCGGTIDPTLDDPPSAREAFLRALPDRSQFDNYDIVLAEQIDAFYLGSPYTNLVEFEIDIALISSFIILISEGFGSIAELGVFSQRKEISERIVIVLQSVHYDGRSFIRDGPIRQFENADESSIQVFDWETKINGNNIELDALTFVGQEDDIFASIRDRLLQIPKSKVLRKTDFGHKLIMANAICEMFGAATFDEIKFGLSQLGLNSSSKEIKRMLFCSKSVGWLNFQKRGNTIYYLPKFDGSPCAFGFREGVEQRDTMRWKRDIRAYWRDNEPKRFRLITEQMR